MKTGKLLKFFILKKKVVEYCKSLKKKSLYWKFYFITLNNTIKTY